MTRRAGGMSQSESVAQTLTIEKTEAERLLWVLLAKRKFDRVEIERHWPDSEYLLAIVESGLWELCQTVVDAPAANLAKRNAVIETMIEPALNAQLARLTGMITTARDDGIGGGAASPWRAKYECERAECWIDESVFAVWLDGLSTGNRRRRENEEARAWRTIRLGLLMILEREEDCGTVGLASTLR